LSPSTAPADLVVSTFLTGAVFGLYVLASMVVWVGRTPVNLRWAISLFCVSGAANMIRGALLAQALLPQELRGIELAVYFLGVGHPGWTLLLAFVLFEDRKLAPGLFAGAIAMFGVTAVELAVRMTSLDRVAQLHALAIGLDGLRDFLRAGLFLWIGVIVIRSWRSDLVQWRRLLRWGVFAVVAVAGLVWIPANWIRYPEWAGALDFWMQLALILAGAALTFQVRADLVGKPVAISNAGDKVSEAGRLALARLNATMNKDELWRREGLTMALLAQEVGVSERQLRRLINEKLGHRNFSSFVNTYRIEAAKMRLADPSYAGRTVAEIAFGLGYTSLGPFNRAFKEATGSTPSAWRKTVPPGEIDRTQASPEAAKAS
jgi:AraC-like DNA-binding protein